MKEEIIVIEPIEEEKIIVIENDIEYISPTTQEKTITPKREQQIVEPDGGVFALSKVTIEAVTNDIDTNIQPNNIKLGVNILGVDGNLEADKPDQSKETTPTKETQIITADTGFELSQVTVNPIPENYVQVEGILEISANGEYDVKNYEKANVNTPTGIGAYFDVAPTGSTYYSSGAKIGSYILKEIPDLDLTGITNNAFGDGLFRNLVNVTKIGKIKTNNTLRQIQYMFNGMSGITDLDLSGIDGTNLTHTQYAFSDVSKVQKFDISHFNMSNVNQCDYMFQSCTNAVEINLPNEVKPTGRCLRMFYNCINLVKITGVIDMINISSDSYGSDIISGCGKLEEIYIKNLKVNQNISTATSLKSECIDYILYNVQDVTASPKTLTLGQNLPKASEDAIAHATSLGWTIN